MYEQIYVTIGIILGIVLIYTISLIGSMVNSLIEYSLKRKIELAERRLKILREMKNPDDRIIYIKNWIEHDIENWKRKL